jgi:hypothetical protein
MKQIFFLIVTIGLTLSSCKKTNSVDPSPASLEGKWRMIIVIENASGLATTKPSSIQGEVEIVFAYNSTTNGIFSGNTPTNEIMQNDYSTAANQSITIPVLSMTKVMETSWGNEFVDNIRSSQSYSFDAGDRLSIKTINKTLIFQNL